MSGFGFSKRVDEIWYEIFFHDALSDFLLFIFYDDFVVGNFDNFDARDGELGVKETFESRALDDNLLNAEIVVCDGIIDNMS